LAYQVPHEPTQRSQTSTGESANAAKALGENLEEGQRNQWRSSVSGMYGRIPWSGRLTLPGAAGSPSMQIPLALEIVRAAAKAGRSQTRDPRAGRRIMRAGGGLPCAGAGMTGKRARSAERLPRVAIRSGSARSTTQAGGDDIGLDLSRVGSSAGQVADDRVITRPGLWGAGWRPVPAPGVCRDMSRRPARA